MSACGPFSPLVAMMCSPGSEVVLRLARRYRRKVLLASTSEVYGKSTSIPFREDADRVLKALTKT